MQGRRATDRCDTSIDGVDKGNKGYSIEFVPFRVLEVGGNRENAEGPTIVRGLRFHEEPCREAFLAEAIKLATDQAATEGSESLTAPRQARRRTGSSCSDRCL